jgi:hypothetical protein
MLKHVAHYLDSLPPLEHHVAAIFSATLAVGYFMCCAAFIFVQIRYTASVVYKLKSRMGLSENGQSVFTNQASYASSSDSLLAKLALPHTRIV